VSAAAGLRLGFVELVLRRIDNWQVWHQPATSSGLASLQPNLQGYVWQETSWRPSKQCSRVMIAESAELGKQLGENGRGSV
jgi:hypothetical protein